MKDNSDSSENFEQLRRLLALKKYEQPPPGYFNRFSGEVVSRIRAGRRSDEGVAAKPATEAPWILQLWRALQARPAFAGAFGAGICALVLAGIFFAEEPAAPPDLAGTPVQQHNAPYIAATPVSASVDGGLGQPLMVSPVAANPSNPPSVNLFDLVPPGGVVPQSIPASAVPPGN